MKRKNEKFNINAGKIIVNNCYLDDSQSQIKFNEEIKIKNNSDNYVYKYCCFYIIKAINQLSSIKDGPSYYRVPKNNSLLKNENQLDALKYFNNTSVVTSKRVMLLISLFSNLNE